MRKCCNKKEDNFITYHQNREKEIERVREWESLNPEKRKEYTIKYYKTEKGHRKRLAQQKRYREKKKLIKENEKLKKDKMELLTRIDKAIKYIDNAPTLDSGTTKEFNIKEFPFVQHILEILKGKE